MVGGLRIQQAHRRAEHAGDLRVVAARVRRARARVALRMARHDQRVQLAEHGERRPVAATATGVGPHTGQREARPRDQSELLERVLDEPGRLDLLEPELGVAPELLAQPDDLLAATVDGLVDPLLQLALGHGVLSVVTRCGHARHSTAASQGAPAYYGGEITRAERKPWTSTMSSRQPASWPWGSSSTRVCAAGSSRRHGPIAVGGCCWTAPAAGVRRSRR